MDPTRLRDLMKRLIEATKVGKLSWEATADENTFRLTLDVGMLHIQRVRQRATASGYSKGDYRRSFLNEYNAIVEEFEGGGNEDTRLLHELYDAARLSALKPSDFLRQVEQEVIRRSG